MITDCFSWRIYDGTDTEFVFVASIYDMMKLVLPAALCLLLWRTVVTNKTLPVTFLGLDDGQSIFEQETISRTRILLYVTTAVSTFVLGVLVNSAVVSLLERI